MNNLNIAGGSDNIRSWIDLMVELAKMPEMSKPDHLGSLDRTAFMIAAQNLAAALQGAAQPSVAAIHDPITANEMHAAARELDRRTSSGAARYRVFDDGSFYVFWTDRYVWGCLSLSEVNIAVREKYGTDNRIPLWQMLIGLM